MTTVKGSWQRPHDQANFNKNYDAIFGKANVTIECYYDKCPHHSTHFEGEGPFCDAPKCKATEQELAGYKLERQGYNLDELERDNPYNQWTHE